MSKNSYITLSKESIKLTHLISLLVTIILFFIAPSDINRLYFILLLSISIINSIVFFNYLKQSYGRVQWLSITSFFILSYCIVAFQIPILYVFGFEIKGLFERFIWANTNVANKSLTISSIAILAYYVGYVYTKSYRFKSLTLNTKALRYRNDSSIIFLIVMSYFFYGLFFATSGSYSLGYYGVGDQSVTSNYYMSGFNSFLTAAIILRLFYLNSTEVKNKKVTSYIKQMGLPITILTFWHISFSLFVGDRGPVISYGLLYFSVFLIRWRQIKFVQATIFLVVLASLLTIVRFTRVREGKTGYFERLSNSYSNNQSTSLFENSNTPLGATMDLAYSIRSLHHAVNEVPNGHPYMMGHYQAINLVSGIPRFGGLYNKYVMDGEYKYQGSAFFLTYLAYGNNARSGEGTIPSADLYLDFGIIGVFFGFLIFGIFSRKADEALSIKKEVSLFLWISALIYFSGAIYLGRGALLFYFQNVIQVYIVILLNTIILITSRK
jgi:hypothetical protein